jgi:hypothetical protein
MNWKKGLGWSVFLVGLTGALWLACSSRDVRRPDSTALSTAPAGRDHPSENTVTPPKRPWHDSKPRPIAGPPVFPPKPPPQVLHVEWRGNWYPAEILNSSGSSNFIRYVGYGPEWDEWVSPDRMRYQPVDKPATTTPESPAEPVRMQPLPGDLVVKWGNRWWRAEVIQTQGDKSLIRYIGYTADDDEWVTPDRIKTFSAEDADPPPEPPVVPQSIQEPVVHGSPAKGDLLVQWGGQWWPAEILQSQGTNYFIRYKGYGPEWDEWITPERMGLYEGDNP